MKQTVTCEATRRKFEITPQEWQAYQSFQLPLPTLCPEERLRRNLAFRNDRQLFWRKCDATGARIFSAYPAFAPFPVVSLEYWNSLAWDGTKYGTTFDFKLPFFEQLFELWQKVSRPACSVKNSRNAQVVQNGVGVVDSFMIFGACRARNCYYSNALLETISCIDCNRVSFCELCYECIDCHHCKELRWSEHCAHCEQSAFLFNCKNCKHCLLSANLEGKEHVIFNRQYSREEYSKMLSDLSLHVRSPFEQARERFLEFLRDHPIPHIYSDRVMTTSGNYLSACNFVIDSFECIDCQNLCDCHDLFLAKHCLDTSGYGDSLEYAAQCVMVGGQAKNLINCIDCANQVSNLMYCGYCENSRELLACVGLKNREYCIFNTQYSKSAYVELRARVEQHLKEKKIWGVFFPTPFSDYPYNRSLAQDFMPLNKTQAGMLHFSWDDHEDEIKPSQLLGSQAMISGSFEAVERFSEVPPTLAELKELSLQKAVFLCEITGKPFQFSQEEVDLYHRLDVPPPARTFEQRYRERLMRLAPRKMNVRKSSQSGAEIRTSFPPDWKQPVYEYQEWRDFVTTNSR